MTSTDKYVWQPRKWCDSCRRQCAFCICAKCLGKDPGVVSFRSKYRSSSLPEMIQARHATSFESAAKVPGKGFPIGPSPTLKSLRGHSITCESWPERLHDQRLADRLSFLQDEQSERRLRNQVVKAVDKAHFLPDSRNSDSTQHLQ